VAARHAKKREQRRTGDRHRPALAAISDPNHEFSESLCLDAFPDRATFATM
jgi:hypothetical protein